MAKIINFSQACKLSKKFRHQGKRVIWTSGFFDIIHVGHIEFFQKIRHLIGKEAVFMVGIDTDEYLKRTKGMIRPIFNQIQRSVVLGSLSYLDYIVLLEEKNPTTEEFVRRYLHINPSTVVIGNTDKENITRIKKQTAEAGITFKHIPHKIKNISTSEIASQIARYSK